MSASAIEWTDRVWNPTTGCTQISPGCAHCYAKTFAARLQAMGQPKYQNDGGKGSGPGFALTLHPDVLEEPLRWKKPSRVFVNSMSDLFHEDVPFEFIDRVFAVMALAYQHTFQILTKRPERMRQYLGEWRYTHVELAGKEMGYQFTRRPQYGDWPLPNVWLGVTVENQRWADERIPILLDTPAAVRFVSAEPLLGRVDLEDHLPLPLAANHEWRPCVCAEIDPADRPCVVCVARLGLDWVIVGGESGPKHRPFNPDWARSIVAQCRDAGVAAFVKQMGGFRPGNKLEDLPEDLRVREFPEVRR